MHATLTREYLTQFAPLLDTAAPTHDATAVEDCLQAFDSIMAATPARGENVYGGRVYSFGDGDPELLVVAHADTVQSSGDRELAHYKRYTVSGNFITSVPGGMLGADNKAGLMAIAMLALLWPPRRNVAVCVSPNEETGDDWLLTLLEDRALPYRLARAAIVVDREAQQSGVAEVVMGTTGRDSAQAADLDRFDSVTQHQWCRVRSDHSPHLVHLMMEGVPFAANISCGQYNTHQTGDWIDMLEVQTAAGRLGLFCDRF